ncbi:MAG TPA: class I SAM-dependent methyltransferase, partial [Thermoguttaceae bacterium]
GYQYQPISYGDFRQFMKLVPIRPQQDVFLDFGSGMGRALCLAATHPFRKVIGVEISPDLNAIAEKNISRLRHKLQCQDIQIVTSDATTYAVHADVTIAYFFTPFSSDILAKVLDNIARSLRENPRQLLILYCGSSIYPGLQSQLVNCPWLTIRSETILPTGRVGTVYENKMWTGG